LKLFKNPCWALRSCTVNFRVKIVSVWLKSYWLGSLHCGNKVTGVSCFTVRSWFSSTHIMLIYGVWCTSSICSFLCWCCLWCICMYLFMLTRTYFHFLSILLAFEFHVFHFLFFHCLASACLSSLPAVAVCPPWLSLLSSLSEDVVDSEWEGFSSECYYQVFGLQCLLQCWLQCWFITLQYFFKAAKKWQATPY